MLSSRWTAFAAPDHTETHCSVVAVQLTLCTPDAGTVLDTWAGRIADALPAPGLLGLMLERTDSHMRLVSAWSRRSEMAEFERGPLHREAKAALHRHVLPPTVAVWGEARSNLPPDWQEVQQRLDVASARQRPDGPAAITHTTASLVDPTHEGTTP